MTKVIRRGSLVYVLPLWNQVRIADSDRVPMADVWWHRPKQNP